MIQNVETTRIQEMIQDVATIGITAQSQVGVTLKLTILVGTTLKVIILVGGIGFIRT